MIIREVHWEIKQRYNKMDSNSKKDFTPMELDALIWDVVMDYVEIFYSGNNLKKYKLGFEVTQQRIDMLSSLVVTDSLQPSLIPNVTSLNKYEFYLGTPNLVEDYLHLVRVYANTNCGKINVKIERHGDLNYILEDSFRKPSKRWRRLVGTLSKSSSNDYESSLYIHSENDFIVDNLDIEYIKVPIRPYFGGYNSIEYNQCIKVNGSNCNDFYNNATTIPVMTDINENYHGLLVDMVVQEISRRLEDGNRFSLKQDKIQTIT